MKKIYAAVTLTIFTGLLLSGCTGAPVESPSPGSTVSDVANPNSTTSGSESSAPSASANKSPSQSDSSNKSADQSAPAAAAVSPMPEPDEAQKASLTAEFKKIDPTLDTPQAIENARRTCTMIQRGGPEAAQLSFARRVLRDANIKPGAASDEAAKKIVEVIKSNGFCKTS